MWMTSSSRAETVLLLLLIAAGCASVPPVPESVTPPDAPQPAIEEGGGTRPPYVQRKYARIELAAARVRTIDADLARFAGPEFLKKARDPVAVEATTTSELPPPLGASSPVLIINGQLYPDTWFVRPNRLIAFVADRGTLRAENRLEAMWLGAGEQTRSEKPVIFKP
jgi:hypothetical protein